MPALGQSARPRAGWHRATPAAGVVFLVGLLATGCDWAPSDLRRSPGDDGDLYTGPGVHDLTSADIDGSDANPSNGAAEPAEPDGGAASSGGSASSQRNDDASQPTDLAAAGASAEPAARPSRDDSSGGEDSDDPAETASATGGADAETRGAAPTSTPTPTPAPGETQVAQAGSSEAAQDDEQPFGATRRISGDSADQGSVELQLDQFQDSDSSGAGAAARPDGDGDQPSALRFEQFQDGSDTGTTAANLRFDIPGEQDSRQDERAVAGAINPAFYRERTAVLDFLRDQNAGTETAVLDITFDHGSAQLDRTDREDLTALVETVAALERPVEIAVTGHASRRVAAQDARTARTRNRRMAERRAQAVADRLAELGVPTGQIATQVAGADRPRLTELSAAGEAANRRASVALRLE